MAKRKAEDDNTCFGFAHEISPVKVSKNNARYFDLSLQTNTSQYRRVVCFDMSKRSTFETAAKGKSPLKLMNVTEVPSRTSNLPDILVNSKSSVQSSKKLDFHHHQPGVVQTASTNLVDVKDLPERSLVFVNVKVVKIMDPSVQMMFGDPTKQQHVVVTDSTGQIRIALWDKLVGTLTSDHCYHFTDLSVRTYKGQIYLTTTKNTKIQETNSIENAHDYVETESNHQLRKLICASRVPGK